MNANILIIEGMRYEKLLEIVLVKELFSTENAEL